MLGSAPSEERWHTEEGVQNSALLCISWVTLAVAGELPEFLLFIYKMRLSMRTLKACQKDGRDFHILRMSMWKFPVKTTLKEAPDCQ